MKHILKFFFFMLIAAGSIAVIVSCNGKPETEDPVPSRFITGVIIPIESEFTPDFEYVIEGKGFQQGDKIFFEMDGIKIEATVAAVTANSATIIIPASLEDGKQYKIVVYRGANNQTLGTTTVTIKIISNLVIPAELKGAIGDEISISGNGFKTGDRIVLVQNIDVVTVTKSFTTTGITFVIPQEAGNGKVTLKLRRADTDYRLGESTLAITISLTVTDKAGATIKGVVFSGGRTLSGVSVSDGDLITQTDENGRYWLNSTKRNKLAFVILPSGFGAPVVEGMPQFWATCKQAATVVEQINFDLLPADNDKHTIVAFTDCHLANRNTPLDLTQFRDGMINELKNTYNNEKNVFGVHLGDLSWDQYWYAQSYALPNARKEFAALNFPVYMTMGNHDNDPYLVGDFNGENTWRSVMGPVYYSMNIGKVHYLMLDNITWINTGGAQGVVGQRNYGTGIDAPQLERIKKDLALVDANTPIIVGFHIPAISYSGVTGGRYNKPADVVSTMSALMTELRKFNTVHLITGHSHDSRNITIDYQQGSFERREHNVVATSATWWWTNQYTTPNRINVTTDGTPSGVKVFEIDGKNIKWHYKALGHPRERQFIAFDMNEVKKYWATNATAQTAFGYSDFAARRNDYNSIGDNEVLIYIWSFEQDFWKVTVKEGATNLTVDAVWLYCPLHTISYDIPRRASGNDLTASFVSGYTSHMYRVKTASATSSLEITVEDRFGNVYTQTMTRPKALTTKIE
jgi:predicted MPP superfamily phosphohydrolase